MQEFKAPNALYNGWLAKYARVNMKEADAKTRQLPLSSTAILFLFVTKAGASAQSSSVPVLMKKPTCEAAPRVVEMLALKCQLGKPSWPGRREGILTSLKEQR